MVPGIGGYTSDTTGKCMTISQTKWVTNWMDSCYLTPALYTATIGGAVVNTTGGTLNVSTSNVGDGIELTLAGIVPGVEQELNFEFEEVYRGTPQIWVTEEQNGVQVSLGSVLVRDKGVTTLRVKSKFGNIKVLVLDIYEVKMKKVCVKVPQLIQQEMLVDVCSDMKDRYRFGFNGQEKVNEWSGVGNHNTATFWEYDTRTGRRLNLDPVDQINISNYAVNGLNPIWFNDPEGDVFGWDNVITGVIGAVVGGAIELGSQMISNYVQGKSVLGDVDWADVGISAFEGLIVGGSQGASLALEASMKIGSSVARASFDYKSNPTDAKDQGYKTLGGFFGGRTKPAKDVVSDVISEGVGLGMGVGGDKLGKKVGLILSNGVENLTSKLSREATGKAIDLWGGGIIDSYIGKGMDNVWSEDDSDGKGGGDGGHPTHIYNEKTGQWDLWGLPQENE